MIELGGYQRGPRTPALQSVFHPDEPERVIVVRMGYPIHEDVLKSHLEQLGISEERFQGLYDRWRPRR